MLSRAATRTTTSLVSKRGFHATRARLSSPYHYPEGPYTNLPFNPRSKWFGVGYWTFMATGFFAPFGIAGACFIYIWREDTRYRMQRMLTDYSLANLQAHLSVCGWYRIWDVCIGSRRESMDGG